MSKSLETGLPVLARCWFVSLAASLPALTTRLKFWLDAHSVLDGSMHSTICAVLDPAIVSETKFIVDLDYVRTLSSPVPSCVLFVIVCSSLLELKLLILTKRRRLFHSSRVKLPFGQNTSMLVLGVNKFDLDFRVKINSVVQPIQRNSVGSGHVSHRWILAFRDHLITASLSFKIWSAWQHDDKISRLRRHDRQWTTQDLRSVSESWFGWWCVCLTVCWAAGLPALALRVSVFDWRKNETLQKPMIESGNSIHTYNCIERNDFSFLRTVWNKSLFLTHPTCGKKCVTAEHTQDSPEVDFESSRSPPVKSVFWNNPSLHCSALYPTWQYCSNSLVRWT